MTQSADNDAAELLAIEALAFIAADSAMLRRFSAISGIAPEAMRQAAAVPGFLAGVLSFLLNHEPDLLAFCAQAHKQPASLAQALARLPGGGSLTPDSL